MFNYSKINNYTGWIIFGIATLVYWLTVEPTASFWDCGEFIATSYKLEVSHPPGAPFFMLINRMFSFLAMGDPLRIAYWINISSVLCSGFTILFLFWSLTMLGLKILKVDRAKASLEQTVLIMGGAAVGSLIYTFSDSFWFSAVEAEVYAMSSLFTAAVVWMMLKWEFIEDESASLRWLIMIAYVMGLSIGVHLLNLLTIPALGLIYYFKKYEEATIKGVFITLAVSSVILLFINDIIIPGLPTWAGDFELFFVNTLSLPFGSGIVSFIVAFLGALIYGVYYSQKMQKPILNTFLLGFVFILIGYSSFSIIPIRSNYNPPIDENDPNNIVSFVSYLKREQYGTRPLGYGQYFDAEVVGTEVGAPVYVKGKDKYEIADHKIEYQFDDKRKTLFPRIWSNSPRHVQEYQNMLGLRPGEQPTFSDNLSFFFSHQIGTMFMRYFMWNFSGRESDIQGASWVGITDAFKDLPSTIKDNKAHNVYFMLPLILGLFGVFFNFNKDPKTFFFLLILFLITGLALVMFLNSPPIEPRERDYIYVGAFYVFAMWCGIGVFAIAELLGKFTKGVATPALATALCLVAPAIMAQQNWDDHDRSNRYFSVDSARNFLAGLAPNAIIFTGGDNDTFPLWYVQEVENFRTDVRVIVLSYFNTDWYIDQMKRKAYESEALPFTFEKEHYRQGGPNDYAVYQELPSVKKGAAINAKQYISLLRKGSNQLQFPTRSGGVMSVVPSKSMYFDVDTSEVLNSNLVPDKLKPYVTDKLVWSLKGNGLEKNTIMLIDLITNNNWERPIYFNNTSLSSIGIDLSHHVAQEGNVYRLLPIDFPGQQQSGEYLVDTETMYDNVMNKFAYRSLDDPKVYYDENYRNFVLNTRSNINSLILALLEEGDDERAKEVMNATLERIPDEAVPYDYTSMRMVRFLLAVNEKAKAMEIIKVMGDRAIENLDYNERIAGGLDRSTQMSMMVLGEFVRILKTEKEDALAVEMDEKLRHHYARFGG
ncbi:DUF2723 domain-containing protein [Persicobacter diffluens]|uniref:Membrane protein n=1 Tax=Persicobacter diffluens TaxID=981 RepID=A0AAN4VUX1_9BACT|nr:membrane protein [Persicobacter diffluens]